MEKIPFDWNGSGQAAKVGTYESTGARTYSGKSKLNEELKLSSRGAVIRFEEFLCTVAVLVEIWGMRRITWKWEAGSWKNQQELKVHKNERYEAEEIYWAQDLEA